MLMNLELEHPIIQAPMAGVTTPELAAAVSNAGGLGSLGIGSSTLAQARQAIEKTRALTARPFNVNVFCHRPAAYDPDAERAWLDFLAPLYAEYGVERPARLVETYPSILVDEDSFAMLLELRPAVVSFHFGLPRPDQIAALKDLGIRMMATATSPDDVAGTSVARVGRFASMAGVAPGIDAGLRSNCALATT